MPRRYFLVPSGVDPLQHPIQQRKRDWMRIFWIALGIAFVISVWFALTAARAGDLPEETQTPTITETVTTTPTLTASPTPTESPSPTPSPTRELSSLMPSAALPSPTVPMLPTWTNTPVSTAIPGGVGEIQQTNKPQPTQTPWIVERVVNNYGVTQVPIPVVQTRVVEVRVTVIVPVTVVVTATPTNTAQPTNTPIPTATPMATLDYSNLVNFIYLPILYHMIDQTGPNVGYPAP